MTESLSNQGGAVHVNGGISGSPQTLSSNKPEKTGIETHDGRSYSEPSGSMADQTAKINDVAGQSLPADISKTSEQTAPSFSHESRLINEDTGNLSRIAQSIQDVAQTRIGASEEETRLFEMPNIANTQNPVAKLGMPFFIPRGKVPNTSTPSVQDYKVIIGSSLSKHKATFANMTEVNKEFGQLFKNVLGIAYSREKNADQKIYRVLTAFKIHRQEQIDFADVKGSKPIVDHLDDIINSLSEMLPIDMEGVQSHYEKQEVTDKLEAKLEGASEEEAVEIKQAIAKISSTQGDFISETQLDSIVSGGLSDVKAELTELVQSTEVIHQNRGRKDIPDKLRTFAGLAPKEVVSYAFKTGRESHRELLAGKFARQLGLSKFLVNKYAVSFENAKLGDEQNPQGIASRWLEGADDLPLKDFDEFLQLEKKCEQLEFSGKDASNYRSRMETLKERMIPGYKRPPPSAEKKEQLRASVLKKILRAAETSKRIHGGTEKGASPMQSIYHPELIDAQHAYGAEVHPFWQVWESNDLNTDSFSEWMGKIRNGEPVEGENQLRAKNLIGPGSPQLRHVTYLEEEERPAYELQFDKGSGTFSTEREGSLSTTNRKDHPHIFVISPDNKVYVGQYTRGNFNHSSLLAGGAVQSAGELIFEEGKLVEITDKSGHYKPNQDRVLKGLQVLQDQGVDLSQVKITINTGNPAIENKSFNALEFLQTPPEPTPAPAPAAVQPAAKAESKSSAIGTESLEHMVLLDALCCSYDSHVKQYKVQDGQVFNFDFARFLAPNEAFIRGENVFVSLRSSLMDHPVTTVPMSSQIINQIKSWNTEQIEADLKEQGLVGNESEFQEAAEKLRSLESKPSEIQEETFKQIHPKAMKRMKERITALQDFIQECESAGTEPTMRGAFDKMYPDIAPFMKVCRRMDFNPSASIGISGGAQRSLQSIIDDAKKYDLASADEIQEMNQALENLRQNASSIQEAQTAIIT